MAPRRRIPELTVDLPPVVPEGLRIERVPIADLVVDPANVRRHPERNLRAITESLDTFGQQKPIVVGPGNVVVAGNGTLDAARALAWTHLDVVRTSLAGADATAFAIADNRTSELAEWDDEGLASLLQSLPSLEGTGFDDADLNELLASLSPKPTPLTDPDEVPGLVAEVRTRKGDLWLLGPHRVLCGDSTDRVDVLRLLAGVRPSLLVTDPPYGVSYADKNRFLNAVWPANRIQEPILNDHESPDDMQALWMGAFSTWREHLRPGAAYYTTGPQGGDLLLLLLLSLRDAGYPLRHMLIWAKQQFVIGRSDYHYQHEPVIYGWVEGSHEFHGGRGEASLWQIDKPHVSDLHPTTKPVELFARAMRNSSRHGEPVCDPFLGAGTAVIAAHQEGRVCCGVEIDPRYVDVAARRFQEHTGIVPILEATGEPHDFTSAEGK